MALRIDQWEIEARPWGWIRLREHSGGGPSVYLQYQLGGSAGHERFDLQTVVMRAGKEAVTGRLWRRIPLSQIEKSLSLMLLSDLPTETMRRGSEQALASFASPDVVSPSLDVLEKYFETTKDMTRIFFNNLPSDMLVSDGADALPKGRFPRIKAPEGRMTDAFLEDVADAYRWFTDAQQAPAPAIAEISGAPVRTVHRWVYEARKRGILPPARTGRAG